MVGGKLQPSWHAEPSPEPSRAERPPKTAKNPGLQKVSFSFKSSFKNLQLFGPGWIGTHGRPPKRLLTPSFPRQWRDSRLPHKGNSGPPVFPDNGETPAYHTKATADPQFSPTMARLPPTTQRRQGTPSFPRQWRDSRLPHKGDRGAEPRAESSRAEPSRATPKNCKKSGSPKSVFFF